MASDSATDWPPAPPMLISPTALVGIDLDHLAGVAILLLDLFRGPVADLGVVDLVAGGKRAGTGQDSP